MHKDEKILKKLNEWYTEASSIDKKIFTEQRSNLSLYMGDHYAKQGSRFSQHIRNMQHLDQTTKIRITKNHIQKICKKFVNNIMNFAPGVMVAPHNESELQDQKSAELNQSVWQFIKNKHKLNEFSYGCAEDLVIIGECFVKIYWNPQKGRHVGYQQEIDPATGEGVFEEDGMSPKKGKAVFSGDLCFERILAYNVKRCPTARSIEESPYLIIEKLVPMEEAKAIVGFDADKIKKLEENDSLDYITFTSGDQKFVETKGQVLFKEVYIRPCADYPNGYFYLHTTSGIVNEMELPFGVFPLIYVGFDSVPGTPRHYSSIKVARPFQAELNRCASAIVETQITLGSDKIITLMGTKVSQGSYLPGIRNIQVSGEAPTILPGRSGEQYIEYMEKITSEMYSAVGIDEDSQEKQTSIDPHAQLFRAMREKKYYSRYGEKMEWLLRDMCQLALDIFRIYAPDDEIIPAIGKSEMVNMEEFKSSENIRYKIKLVPNTEDIETKLGKQLQITSMLQYVSSSLTPENLGKLWRMMPYTNGEQMFEDLTMDYDNATNDILAMDRGEYPESRPYDNKKEYMIQRFASRMSKPDFKYLHPYIQGNYQKKIAEYEQIIAIEVEKIKQAQQELIPVGGVATPVDLYVKDPTSPNKTVRAKVPYSALLWLIEQLENQKVTQEALNGTSSGLQADIAGMTTSQQTTSNQGMIGGADLSGGLANSYNQAMSGGR